MKIVLLIFFAMAALSCSDEGPTAPPPSTAFSVSLTVTAPGGSPVPGLRIGVWNHPAPWTPGSEGMSACTFRFDVPQIARIRFTLLDMDGRPDTTLIGDQVLPAGMWMLTGGVSRPYGTRVYRCRLVATDTAGGSPLFDRSLYSVLWQFDADIALLGWTSSNGTFQTGDSLSFPHLLSVPTLVSTSSGGPDSLGVFVLPDSVAVALTDTSTGEGQITYHRITKGPNAIRITWDPTRIPGGLKSRPASSPALRRMAGEIPEEWRLYYPFPNPFN